MRDLAGQCINYWTIVFIKEELPHTIHYAPHKPAATEENEKKQDINKDNDSEDDDLADLPFIAALEASGQSRLTNEFEVLRSLGKGGFGDVIEVRNKLDRINRPLVFPFEWFYTIEMIIGIQEVTSVSMASWCPFSPSEAVK
ncbi:uncharacterized protein [Mytilus edulis]|uniref:uncharacterized protein n=1 Tax=Mytilus edulis TaxID=6550 RepID=UPI0039F070E7